MPAKITFAGERTYESGELECKLLNTWSPGTYEANTLAQGCGKGTKDGDSGI
jgi:hypothetical protein